MVEEDKEKSTKQILDLAAERRREKQVVDVEAEKTLIVVFALWDQPPAGTSPNPVAKSFYGLHAADVESIVTLDEITYIPGTPPWILGVVNVRGEIESVLDLKAVLGLDRAKVTAESRLLIAQQDSLRSGLLVDQVVDIVEVPLHAIHSPPTPLEGGKGVYIEGEAQYLDETLILLNLSEVFRRALETGQV